jgi:glutaredoxin 2
MTARTKDGRELRLELFKFDSCPYCVKVQRVVDRMRIPVTMRDILEDDEAARTLVEVGGEDQVPCLFIDGRPLYESDDIVAFLQRNFAAPGGGGGRS